MAQITWRNVDAPDFRTSLEGIRAFGGMFDKAVTGLSSGLEGYDQSISDKVNRALALEIAGAQNTDAAKALAAGAATRPDAARISTALAAALAARPGELTRQATGELDLGMKQYGFGRAQDTDTRTDAARGDANRVLMLAAAGDEAGARSLLDSSESLRGMDYKDLAAVAGGQQDLIKGIVGIEGGRLNNQRTGVGIVGDMLQNETSRFNLSEAKVSAADKNAAQAAVMAVRRMGASPEDARGVLASMNLSPGAFNAAVGVLSGEFPGMYGAISNGEAASAGGNFSLGSAQKDVARELKGSGLSDAVVAGFLGNFHIEGGYTGAQGDGGSAGGIAQWRDERRSNFQRVIGKDPTRASPAEQARFVKWELDNPKQAGMTGAQANAIKNAKDPATAARLIDRFYERSNQKSTGQRAGAAMSAYDLINGAGAAQDGVRNRRAQNERNSIVPNWDRATNDRRTIQEVAADLASKDLKGIETKEQIAYRIQEGMKLSGGNEAQVGEAIRRSVRTASQGGSWFGLNRGSTPSNLKSVIDSKALRATLTSIGNGGTAGEVQNSRELQQVDQQLSQARAARAQAAQVLAAARSRAQSDPAARLVLPRYEQADRNAAAQLTALMNKAVSKDYKAKTPTLEDTGEDSMFNLSSWTSLFNLKRGK